MGKNEQSEREREKKNLTKLERKEETQDFEQQQ